MKSEGHNILAGNIMDSASWTNCGDSPENRRLTCASYRDAGLTIMFAREHFQTQEWFSNLRPYVRNRSLQLNDATGITTTPCQY